MNSSCRRAVLIIVTFNSYGALSDIAETIRQFEANHSGNHVVVVENSSDYRVREYLEAKLKSHKFMVEVASSNEGFSHGVNLGWTLACERWGTFDFVVLLNPDIVSAGRTVCELVNRAAKDFNLPIGVWGAVLRDPHGGIDRGCARRVLNRRRFFSHLVGYHSLVKLLRTAPQSLTEDEIANEQSELAMVSGGLMCIRASVLGCGLDTLLPLYLEDQEICLRSLAQGYKNHVYPDLEAMHLGGASRKSITENDHALRIMELVEAPVQCMVRLQNYTLLSLRLTVFAGGVLRFMGASIAAAYKIPSRNVERRREIAWMADQQRLATWMIRWAITGAFHTSEVSLSEYFGEYAAARSRSRYRPRRWLDRRHPTKPDRQS